MELIKNLTWLLVFVTLLFGPSTLLSVLWVALCATSVAAAIILVVTFGLMIADLITNGWR